MLSWPVKRLFQPYSWAAIRSLRPQGHQSSRQLHATRLGHDDDRVSFPSTIYPFPTPAGAPTEDPEAVLKRQAKYVVVLQWWFKVVLTLAPEY